MRCGSASRRSPRWRELFDAGARRVRGEILERGGADFSMMSSTSITSPGTVDSVAATESGSCAWRTASRAGGRDAGATSARHHRGASADAAGLRSLASDEPGYTGHYAGGVAARDGSYHQGTVWPWLLAAFVEAWVRSRGRTPAANRRRTRTISRAASRTPRRSRARACFGDRRRRRSASTQRLPVPGMVGRRGVETRANRPGAARSE